MQLTSKEKETLQCLIKIEKYICKRYEEIKTPQDAATIVPKLLPIIDEEMSLIRSLNLSAEKINRLEHEYETRANLSLYGVLLFSTKVDINKTNVHYYRLFARLREVYFKAQTNAMNSYSLGYVDTIVKVLYGCLIEKRDQAIDNYEELNTFAKRVLIDSSEAEVEILKNGLNPLDKIYNPVEMNLNGWEFKCLKELAEQFNIEGITVSENSTAEAIRFLFNSTYKELIPQLESGIHMYGIYITEDAEFILLESYLKSIIALLDKEDRAQVYRTMLGVDKNGKRILNGKIRKYATQSMEEIESDVVPHIMSLSFGTRFTV